MKIRREYQLTIKMGSKHKVFTYYQATAYETLKFMEDIKEEDFNLIYWLYDFLNKVCVSKSWFLARNNLSKRNFSKYVVDFEKIFETIQKTYFFGAFTKGKTEDEEEAETMPFDAYLTLLSEKLNIDPLSLLKSYTFEQISELGKGIVYVINMQSEEGKKKNERAKLEEKMKNVDKDHIADQLARLESYKKKKMSGPDNKTDQSKIENTIS